MGLPILFLLLVAFEVAITIPAVLFAGNSTEFEVSFWALAGAPGSVIFLSWVGLSLLLIATGYLVRAASWPRCTRGIQNIVGVAAVALAIGTYVHSHILIPNYGAFDGQDIDWSLFAADRWIDLLVWSVAIGVGFVVVRARSSIAVGLWSFLALSQVLALAPTLPVVFAAKTATANSATSSNMFELSSNRNVIVIVLDAFESPAFNYILGRYPEWNDRLSGFTYYRNATAHFPTTFLSIPAILSGAIYDNREPIANFLDRVLPDHSLPSVLKNQGVPVDMVTLGLYCPRVGARSCTTIHGLAASDSAAALSREQAKLVDLTLFRTGPQILKRWVYNDQQWRFQARNQKRQGPAQHVLSIELVERFEREARLGAAPLSFKFYHLMIPHTPLRLDANCDFSREFRQITRRDFSVQARCALRLVERMIERLKALGVYDSSMILVTADHGFVINYGDYKRPKDMPELARALPLVLLKPFGATGLLSINTSPVELGDIPATIGAALGIEQKFPGIPFGVEKPEDRRRIFRNYAWKNEYWAKGYLPKVTEYEITGDAWRPEFWRKLGEVRAPE